ncbi:MAG: hypothetical protein JNK04_05835 [Myxococcales bacterium]|nr:hypothetical protein [Myxococcales bacterium]
MRKANLEPGPVTAVLVGRRGRWLLVAGRRIDLSRHRALRRIAVALADAFDRGDSLSTQDLFSLGWPGESADVSAAANRVYVAVALLRKLGLRGLIVRQRGGYVLSGVTVEKVR